MAKCTTQLVNFFLSQVLPQMFTAISVWCSFTAKCSAKYRSNLCKEIVCDLQEVINYVNPYMSLYHSVWDLLNANPAQGVSLVMRTSNEDIDSQQYNVPTGTDIAMIIPVENDDQPLNKNIVIYKNRESHPEKNNLILIDDKHPMYNPLLYVLMLPYGYKGWELRCACTQLQYYAYRLMAHSGDTFNIVHRVGHLFQQYIVGMYS